MKKYKNKKKERKKERRKRKEQMMKTDVPNTDPARPTNPVRV
jgi:hypothetical protein